MDEKVNEGSVVILPDFGKAYDRRRFITGTSAALAAIGLTTRQAAAQDIEKVTDAQRGESASDPGPENNLLREASPNSRRIGRRFIGGVQFSDASDAANVPDKIRRGPDHRFAKLSSINNDCGCVRDCEARRNARAPLA
jgi:hypothetical protein